MTPSQSQQLVDFAMSASPIVLPTPEELVKIMLTRVGYTLEQIAAMVISPLSAIYDQARQMIQRVKSIVNQLITTIPQMTIPVIGQLVIPVVLGLAMELIPLLVSMLVPLPDFLLPILLFI